MIIPAMFVYNAIIASVTDGDTIGMVIDRGMYDYTGSLTHPIPVRVLGINSRELSEPGGLEARDNLRHMLPPGTPVVLTTVKPDKYAPRWLARVDTQDYGNLGDFLIGQQWAASYSGSGPKNVPPWPRTVG